MTLSKLIKTKMKKQVKYLSIIAKKTGLSPRTYERAKTIIENGSEEIKVKLRQGKTKIAKQV